MRMCNSAAGRALTKLLASPGERSSCCCAVPVCVLRRLVASPTARRSLGSKSSQRWHAPAPRLVNQCRSKPSPAAPRRGLRARLAKLPRIRVGRGGSHRPPAPRAPPPPHSSPHSSPSRPQLALERCATARCAITTMGSLAEAHGYYGGNSHLGKFEPWPGLGFGGEAEALLIGDARGELWIFHILPGPGGPGRGAVRAASRARASAAAPAPP